MLLQLAGDFRQNIPRLVIFLDYVNMERKFMYKFDRNSKYKKLFQF